mmetsp:Transcript_69313/g.137435  ORF Transcript_69313/g.137435 Transcript_69313/m.137435 type:complete len:843 (-) Transcript_69313:72-2600(-)
MPGMPPGGPVLGGPDVARPSLPLRRPPIPPLHEARPGGTIAPMPPMPPSIGPSPPGPRAPPKGGPPGPSLRPLRPLLPLLRPGRPTSLSVGGRPARMPGGMPPIMCGGGAMGPGPGGTVGPGPGGGWGMPMPGGGPTGGAPGEGPGGGTEEAAAGGGGTLGWPGGGAPAATRGAEMPPMPIEPGGAIPSGWSYPDTGPERGPLTPGGPERPSGAPIGCGQPGGIGAILPPRLAPMPMLPMPMPPPTALGGGAPGGSAPPPITPTIPGMPAEAGTALTGGKHAAGAPECCMPPIGAAAPICSGGMPALIMPGGPPVGTALGGAMPPGGSMGCIPAAAIAENGGVEVAAAVSLGGAGSSEGDVTCICAISAARGGGAPSPAGAAAAEALAAGSWEPAQKPGNPEVAEAERAAPLSDSGRGSGTAAPPRGKTSPEGNSKPAAGRKAALLSAAGAGLASKPADSSESSKLDPSGGTLWTAARMAGSLKSEVASGRPSSFEASSAVPIRPGGGETDAPSAALVGEGAVGAASRVGRPSLARLLPRGLRPPATAMSPNVSWSLSRVDWLRLRPLRSPRPSAPTAPSRPEPLPPRDDGPRSRPPLLPSAACAALPPLSAGAASASAVPADSSGSGAGAGAGGAAGGGGGGGVNSAFQSFCRPHAFAGCFAAVKLFEGGAGAGSGSTASGAGLGTAPLAAGASAGADGASRRADAGASARGGRSEAGAAPSPLPRPRPRPRVSPSPLPRPRDSPWPLPRPVARRFESSPLLPPPSSSPFLGRRGLPVSDQLVSGSACFKGPPLWSRYWFTACSIAALSLLIVSSTASTRLWGRPVMSAISAASCSLIPWP